MHDPKLISFNDKDTLEGTSELIDKKAERRKIDKSSNREDGFYFDSKYSVFNDLKFVREDILLSILVGWVVHGSTIASIHPVFIILK